MLKMLVKRFNKGASMDNIVGKKSSLSWAVNISVTVLVI
jgi:hypothetical protein